MIARRHRGWMLGVSALIAMELSSARAFCDGDSTAVAEGLFRSGRQLMSQGDFAQACPKFAESNRIDPKLGTLLNLALCHERVGKTASAWAEYTAASETARRLGQAEREQVARERAVALEPTLPHVIIEGSLDSGAAVTLDEQQIRSGAFATAIPVDPGDHVVRATAPGKKPFSESFAMQAGPVTRTVHVSFEAADAPVAPEASPAPTSGAVESARPSSSRQTWGLVIGGSGIAMIGVGAFFGINAFSMKHTAEGECSAAGVCTPAGNDALGTMKTSETISTVSVLAGIGALGVGAYLVLFPAKPADSISAQHTAVVRVGPNLATHGVRMELAW